MADMNNQMFANLNTIILKSLYESDKYGYEIFKEISEKSLGKFVVKKDKLINALRKLERSGCISSYWGITPVTAKKRRYYSMTQIGKNVYLKNMAEWRLSMSLMDKLIVDSDEKNVKQQRGRYLKDESVYDDDSTHDKDEYYDETYQEPVYDKQDDGYPGETDLDYITRKLAEDEELNIPLSYFADKNNLPEEPLESIRETPKPQITYTYADREKESQVKQITFGFHDDAEQSMPASYSESPSAATPTMNHTDPSSDTVSAFVAPDPILSSDRPKFIQLDMFHSLGLNNIDKTIAEYDRITQDFQNVKSLYNRSSGSGIQSVSPVPIVEGLPLDSYKERLYKLESEDRLSKLENDLLNLAYTERHKTDSSFAETPSEKAERNTEKETQQALNFVQDQNPKQAIAETVIPPVEAEETAERDNPPAKNERVAATKEPDLVDFSATVTPPEKDYKQALTKLLTVAKNSEISENLLSDSPVKEMSAPESLVLPTDIIEQLENEAEERSAQENINPHIKPLSGGDIKDDIPPDFITMQAKMQSEGFKMRTHAAATAALMNSNFIAAGKLMLHTLLIMFAIANFELILAYFGLGEYFKLPLATYAALTGISFLLPITGSVIYYRLKDKKIYDRFRFMFAICFATTLACVIFVVSCSVCILSSVNLSIPSELLSKVILPSILALDFPIGVVIYELLRKNKIYKKQ